MQPHGHPLSTSEPVSRPNLLLSIRIPVFRPGSARLGSAGPVGIEVDMGALPAAIWRTVPPTRFRARLCSSLPFRKDDMFVAEPHGSAGVKTNDPSLIAPIAAVG